MIIIRPIKKSDLDIFAELSFEAILGMRNFPRDREKFLAKIEHSEASLAHDVKKAGHEEYLFVLEDVTTGRIGGTSGIFARAEFNKSFFYRIETLDTSSPHICSPKQMQILKVVTDTPHHSEICSLYLQPTFRHSGLGRLLSLCRFLFIASFPHRFEKTIVAELRGYIDQRQISPFWEAVGRHFCELSFVELMAQIDIDPSFIKDTLPKYPLYVDLLPKEAQAVLGKTHENTKPAYQMLSHEGFVFNNEIDVFEAGPTLIAEQDCIRSIQASHLVKIQTTDDLLKEESEFILSNNQLDFRACYGNLQPLQKDKGVINRDVAEALKVKDGDLIRYVSLH